MSRRKRKIEAPEAKEIRLHSICRDCGIKVTWLEVDLIDGRCARCHPSGFINDPTEYDDNPEVDPRHRTHRDPGTRGAY